MAIVTELELPEFDYLADDLTGEVYHQRLAAVLADKSLDAEVDGQGAVAFTVSTLLA